MVKRIRIGRIYDEARVYPKASRTNDDRELEYFFKTPLNDLPPKLKTVGAELADAISEYTKTVRKDIEYIRNDTERINRRLVELK